MAGDLSKRFQSGGDYRLKRPAGFLLEPDSPWRGPWPVEPVGCWAQRGVCGGPLAARPLSGKHPTNLPLGSSWGISTASRVRRSGCTRAARADSAEMPGLAAAPHPKAVGEPHRGVASGPLATKGPRGPVDSVLVTRDREAPACPHKSARAEFLLPFPPITTTLIRRPEAPPRHPQERPVGCRSTSALASACDPALLAPSCRPGHPPRPAPGDRVGDGPPRACFPNLQAPFNMSLPLTHADLICSWLEAILWTCSSIYLPPSPPRCPPSFSRRIHPIGDVPFVFPGEQFRQPIHQNAECMGQKGPLAPTRRAQRKIFILHGPPENPVGRNACLSRPNLISGLACDPWLHWNHEASQPHRGNRPRGVVV